MFGLSDFATCLVPAVCYLSCTWFPKRDAKRLGIWSTTSFEVERTQKPWFWGDYRTVWGEGKATESGDTVSYPIGHLYTLMSNVWSKPRPRGGLQKENVSCEEGEDQFSERKSEAVPSSFLPLGADCRAVVQQAFSLAASSLPFQGEPARVASQVLRSPTPSASSSIQDFVKGASDPRSLMFGLRRSVWESGLGASGAVVFTGSDPLDMVVHSSS